MQVCFIEIYQIFSKKFKVGYFSNRVVYLMLFSLGPLVTYVEKTNPITASSPRTIKH
jgi:hypothetical protein